jgi:Na+/glutamate symporter
MGHSVSPWDAFDAGGGAGERMEGRGRIRLADGGAGSLAGVQETATTNMRTIQRHVRTAEAPLVAFALVGAEIVEVAGFEPASLSDRLGLLRA